MNYIADVWEHMFRKHSGQSNAFDQKQFENMALKIVVEQNVEIIEEMETLKKDTKGAFQHMADIYEENIERMREETNEKCKTLADTLLKLYTKISNLEASYKRKKVRTKPTSIPTKLLKTSSKPAHPETTTPNQKQTSTTLPKATKKAKPSTTASGNSSSKPPRVSSKPTFAKVASSLPKSSATSRIPSPKVPENDVKENVKPVTKYQLKPRVLIVGDSIAHNLEFRKVEIVTSTTIKTAKAYSSVWNKNARFKNSNISAVTKAELELSKYDHLVLAAPTVDITNINTSKVEPTDETQKFRDTVSDSCKNMIETAQLALLNHRSLKKVTIMNHVPRMDSVDVDPLGLKPKLAEFANGKLLQLWLDCPQKDKIFIGSHTLECSAQAKLDRYTDEKSGRYDGVHLYGSPGRVAYTESVLNILISSFQTTISSQTQSPRDKTQPPREQNEENHTRCPQTVHSNQRKEKYNLKVQNKFNPLMGN